MADNKRIEELLTEKLKAELAGSKDALAEKYNLVNAKVLDVSWRLPHCRFCYGPMEIVEVRAGDAVRYSGFCLNGLDSCPHFFCDETVDSPESAILHVTSALQKLRYEQGLRKKIVAAVNRTKNRGGAR